MDSITVYALPIDDYLITAEVIDDAISISVELEHEIVLNLFEYPAEITVLSAKISEVEEVATEASSAATTALAAATTAQSSANAAMSQAEAATDMAATNTLSISNILANFTAWVLGTYLGALTLLDAAIAAGDSLQAMAGKLQGQLNAVKVRLGLLEDNVIFDITTTQDAVSLIITTDKNGNQLNLTGGTYSLSRYSYNGNNNGGGNISSVIINDINSDVYRQLYAAVGYNGINHKGGNVYSEFDVKLTLKNGVLSWTGISWGYDTALANIQSALSIGCSVKTLVTIASINKFTIKDQNSSLQIKAGTRFVLRKVD